MNTVHADSAPNSQTNGQQGVPVRLAVIISNSDPRIGSVLCKIRRFLNVQAAVANAAVAVYGRT